MLIGSIGLFAILSLGLNGNFLFITTQIFLGFGCGGIQVVVPNIILKKGGENYFGTNYGIVMMFSGIGIHVFGFIF